MPLSTHKTVVSTGDNLCWFAISLYSTVHIHSQLHLPTPIPSTPTQPRFTLPNKCWRIVCSCRCHCWLLTRSKVTNSATPWLHGFSLRPQLLNFCWLIGPAPLCRAELHYYIRLLHPSSQWSHGPTIVWPDRRYILVCKLRHSFDDIWCGVSMVCIQPSDLYVT